MNRFIAGAAAGAIGGLAGAAVKQLCEAIVPPRSPDREPPPGVLAMKAMRALDGPELTDEQKENISVAIHYIFSTITSAAYGAIVAGQGERSSRNGVGFGLVLWAGLHEITLPLLGATPPLRKLPAKEQINEFVTHAIFGETVELVRAQMMEVLETAAP